MLTCKFIKCVHQEDGRETQTIIAAPHAEIETFRMGFIVRLFQSAIKSAPSVEYRIADQDDAYDHCYIENAAGKTVQHVRWKK